jgi:glycosyltransferase involved in cell wall biosynthesis
VTAIVMAVRAAGALMGQQQYQQQLLARLPGLLPGFRGVTVRSLRSPLPGDVRLPLNRISRLPLPAQAMVARLALGRADLLFRDELLIPAARREVITVHDLAPLRFDDEGVDNVPRYGPQSVRRARAVICPSEFSAGEVRDLLGAQDVQVIPNGIDDVLLRSDPPTSQLKDHLRRRFGLPDRFVLHSGGATKRKNLVALAAAWSLVHARDPGTALVLCGPPDPRRDLLFDELPGARILGHVAREEQLDLMRAATVVVVPSLYEGFGLPALEAMAAGTAVVAARRASLPEVCGAAALLCEPDAAALGGALCAVLDDAALRARLERAGRERAALFTWDRSARRHAEVLQMSANHPKGGAVDGLNVSPP